MANLIKVANQFESEKYIKAMAVANGQLYAGTYRIDDPDNPVGGRLLRYTGTAWELVCGMYGVANRINDLFVLAGEVDTLYAVTESWGDAENPYGGDNVVLKYDTSLKNVSDVFPGGVVDDFWDDSFDTNNPRVQYPPASGNYTAVRGSDGTDILVPDTSPLIGDFDIVFEATYGNSTEGNSSIRLELFDESDDSFICWLGLYTTPDNYDWKVGDTWYPDTAATYAPYKREKLRMQRVSGVITAYYFSHSTQQWVALSPTVATDADVYIKSNGGTYHGFSEFNITASGSSDFPNIGGWKKVGSNLTGVAGLLDTTPFGGDIQIGTKDQGFLVNWVPAVPETFFSVSTPQSFDEVPAVVTYFNSVYGGTKAGGGYNGGQLMKYVYPNWVKKADAVGGMADVYDLYVYRNYIYAIGDGNKLYRWDTVSAWEERGVHTSLVHGNSMVEYLGKLYIAGKDSSGAILLSYIPNTLNKEADESGEDEFTKVIQFQGDMYVASYPDGELWKFLVDPPAVQSDLPKFQNQGDILMGL